MNQLLVTVAAVVLLGGVALAEGQQATPARDPCEGLDAYLQAYREAMTEYWDVHSRIRLIFVADRVRFRDPKTLSRSELREFADKAETAQRALQAIDPPPWLAEYHQIQIEQMGLESSFAREALRNGVTAAQPAFADIRSELYDDEETAQRRAGEICVDFARLFELSPSDAHGEQRYIVREGDTLAGIAARFGVSVEGILEANHMAEVEHPLVGLELVIPVPTPPGTPVPLATPAPDGGAVELILPAAEATIATYATQVASLHQELTNAQVTATALAVVAANSVLDPNRQTITIQTDLEGMLANNEEALADARDALSTQLSRYPVGCRAGFALISGKAPEIDEGVELARRVEGLLREVRPEVFTEATGVELFALPNTQPFGEVSIDIFFYSGCQPIG